MASVSCYSQSTSSLGFRLTGLDSSYSYSDRTATYDLYLGTSTKVATKSESLGSKISQSTGVSFTGLSSGTTYNVVVYIYKNSSLLTTLYGSGTTTSSTSYTYYWDYYDDTNGEWLGTEGSTTSTSTSYSKSYSSKSGYTYVGWSIGTSWSNARTATKNSSNTATATSSKPYIVFHYTKNATNYTANLYPTNQNVSNLKYGINSTTSLTQITTNTAVSVPTTSYLYVAGTASTDYKLMGWKYVIGSTTYVTSGSTLQISAGAVSAGGSISISPLSGKITSGTVSESSIVVNIAGFPSLTSNYYELDYWADGSSSHTTWSNQSSGNKTVNNLSSGTLYHFRYRYYESSSKYSNWSNTIDVSTTSPQWTARIYRSNGINQISYKVDSGSWHYITASYEDVLINASSTLYIDMDSTLSGYEAICWRWRVGSSTAALNTQSPTRLTMTQSTSTTVYISEHIVQIPTSPTLVQNVKGSMTIGFPALNYAESFTSSGAGGYYKVYTKKTTDSSWSTPTTRGDAINRTYTTTEGNTYQIKYQYFYQYDSNSSHYYSGSESGILTVTAIGNFYWINASTPTINKGYVFGNIPYTKWNEFIELIRSNMTSSELSTSITNSGTLRQSETYGFGYIGTKTATAWLDYAKINTSDKVLYYYKFNIANYMLSRYIASYTFYQVYQGQTVTASLFNNIQNYLNNNT